MVGGDFSDPHAVQRDPDQDAAIGDLVMLGLAVTVNKRRSLTPLESALERLLNLMNWSFQAGSRSAPIVTPPNAGFLNKISYLIKVSNGVKRQRSLTSEVAPLV